MAGCDVEDWSEDGGVLRMVLGLMVSWGGYRGGERRLEGGSERGIGRV